MQHPSTSPITKKNFALLFLVTFLVRALTFQFYVQHNNRYQQPDSPDYHNCATCITWGTGMHRPDTHEPIFWRTPGYPFYLAYFYQAQGLSNGAFEANKPAHITALWVQIILSSFLPLLIFALALLLTQSSTIAWITAWICALHPGFVLASTYLLTEALALLFFIPFLIFFYKNLITFYRQKKNKPLRWRITIPLAAILLGLMTWVRPMGEFVFVLSLILFALFLQSTFTSRLKKMALFAFFFMLVTCGWYIRNYQLTGKWFFCPMLGPYLNTFSAPKIIRDTHGFTLTHSINLLYLKSEKRVVEQKAKALAHGKVYCPLFAGLDIALPIIKRYPLLFARDWIKEVCKSTFDLYSYQLVCFAKNTFMYDPLEEFLTEKWKDCLYRAPLPWFMRFIVYLEVLFELLKWLGLLCGAWLFLVLPLFRRKMVPHLTRLWLITTPMIAGILGMTGGFGYARLRLPVEPLMIILALTGLYSLIHYGLRVRLLKRGK
jgi:hypothetical protein